MGRGHILFLIEMEPLIPEGTEPSVCIRSVIEVMIMTAFLGIH